MALVAQPPASIRTGLAMSGQPSKHKIVLESVTQEKKKLRSVLSFKAEPPKGYTFIPAGNPELTNALKEFARKGNYEIYAVSTTPHQRAHDLSQQVHRIGFHFPSVVVAQVCAYYGIVLTSAGTVVAENEFESFHPRSKRLQEQVVAQERKDQITINTEARDTIRDLFPNISDNDLNQIIKTAFQKGQNKVGTANELSLIRRAQLAVVAHIRHIYTDYDKLLRQTHYRDARNLVEKPTLRRLVQWRGDDENGKQVLEDVFREVVVISDDDSDEEDDHEAMNNFRDVSVEIVSSNTRADHFNPDPLILGKPVVGRRSGDFHPTSSKRPLSYEYVAAPSRKERINDKDKVGRRGFSRYQAWNEAREEYRANPDDALAVDKRALAYSAPEMPFRQPVTGSNDSGHPAEPSSHTSCNSYQYQDTPVHSHNDPLDTFRAHDGTLYERVVKHPSIGSQQPLTRPLTYKIRDSAAAEKVRSTVADSAYLQSRDDGLDSRRDTILPSIEGPQLGDASSQSRAAGVNHSSLPSIDKRQATASQKDVMRRVDDIEFLDLTEDTHYLNKRRRIDDTGPEISEASRAGTMAQNLLPGQREPEYISLLSPGQYSQASNSNALSPLPYQGSRDHSEISASVSKYRDMQEFSSPIGVTHTGERLVARRPAGQPSGLSRIRPYEVLYSSNLSPRIDDESIPSRLHSTLPGGATPVDRGIQEYRAFRAHERQDMALRSPSGRGRPQSDEQSRLAHAVVEPKDGQPRQLDGAWSQPVPPQRLIQESSVVDATVPLARGEEYRLTRGRAAERGHALWRRSASPIQSRSSRMSYVPTLPQSQLWRQRERTPPQYLSFDLDSVPQSGERLEPVLVRPTRRYEEEVYNAPQYLPINKENRQASMTDIQQFYAQP